MGYTYYYVLLLANFVFGTKFANLALVSLRNVAEENYTCYNLFHLEFFWYDWLTMVKH